MTPGGTRAKDLQTYVALLRAVNVSGRNKVSMPELKKLFAVLGARDVSTYVQSGNVVFKSAAEKPDELRRTLEQSLRDELRLDVAVLLRTKAQLKSVLAANPLAGGGREPSKLHVTFLAESPERARVRELAGKDFGADELRVVRREVYLHCPNGYGTSKLTNAFLERQLGVAATTRSWKTVGKLAELAAA